MRKFVRLTSAVPHSAGAVFWTEEGAVRSQDNRETGSNAADYASGAHSWHRSQQRSRRAVLDLRFSVLVDHIYCLPTWLSAIL